MDIANGAIKNLPDPVDPQDAMTKNMSLNSVGRISFVTSINFKTAGKTLLYTNNTTKKFIVTVIHTIPTEAAGLVSIATGSVGTDDPVYSNITTGFGIGAITSAVGKVYSQTMNGTYAVVNPGDSVYGKITVPAVADKLICDVVLLGYLI